MEAPWEFKNQYKQHRNGHHTGVLESAIAGSVVREKSKSITIAQMYFVAINHLSQAYQHDFIC
ncbi:hypothetical protein [Rhodoferax sp.]|uniref:hypothetical protein n=1 Tax=Rhodoferax sp. TaxID=50421 RepID=UPI0025DF5C80|nr:hypothetical protein [Rhodoferax sp.]